MCGCVDVGVGLVRGIEVRGWDNIYEIHYLDKSLNSLHLPFYTRSREQTFLPCSWFWAGVGGALSLLTLNTMLVIGTCIILYHSVDICISLTSWMGWGLSNWDQSCECFMTMWPTPNKNPGHKFLVGFLWLVIFHMCCYTSLLGELSAVCTTLLGKDNRKLVPGLSWTLPYAPFTFTDLNL